MLKLRKPTRIEKGLLLAVVWLHQDSDQPSVAANLAKAFGLQNLDVRDLADFDKEVFQKMNTSERCKFILQNDQAMASADTQTPTPKTNGQ